MQTKITPFSEADIEEAAELLARRHQGDRVHEPALPERFGRPREACLELEHTWKASTVNGMSAGGVAAWQEALDQLEHPAWKIWLALRHGQLVSMQVYLPAQPPRGIGTMVLPEKCSFLGFAATREEEQGQGIGRILTAHGLADDYATGYAFCFTDWRATNLLSSRMWMRQGWRPVAYSLTRRLDERVLWSHAKASPAPWLNTRFANEESLAD